jgi:hypothetical protein
MAADSQSADRQTDPAIAECLAEFQRRRAAGEDIFESAWIARHPLLAPALRREFEDRRKLAEVVAGVGAQNSPTSPEIPVDLDYIGSYQLKERLGQGGMGVVFRATQQGLGRHGREGAAATSPRYVHDGGAFSPRLGILQLS